MDNNMGTLDRTIRVVVGAVLLVAGLNVNFWLKWVLFVLAAVMFITAAIGFCPIYTFCKCNTQTKKEAVPKKAAKKKR